MPFGTDAVDGGFNAGVEQFHNHHNQHGASQESGFYPAATQIKSQRNQKNSRNGLLPEGRFSPTILQALN